MVLWYWVGGGGASTLDTSYQTLVPVIKLCITDRLNENENENERENEGGLVGQRNDVGCGRKLQDVVE